jgi:hypothetical protein
MTHSNDGLTSSTSFSLVPRRILHRSLSSLPECSTTSACQDPQKFNDPANHILSMPQSLIGCAITKISAALSVPS